MRAPTSTNTHICEEHVIPEKGRVRSRQELYATDGVCCFLRRFGFFTLLLLTLSLSVCDPFSVHLLVVTRTAHTYIHTCTRMPYTHSRWIKCNHAAFAATSIPIAFEAHVPGEGAVLVSTHRTGLRI